MSLMLLLDLDDTLLQNKMEFFIPEYLKALSGHLADTIAPDKLVQSLLAATDVMMKNNDPATTLKETFDSQFYRMIGVEEIKLRSKLDSFYTEVFPKLKHLTKRIPEAIDLIEGAIQREYQIAIATNPLFPMKAVIHRLNWAGVPPEEYRYRLIPSYETFHFAKPNPAYFTELLARLNWTDEPVVMVGDDCKMDIQAAQNAGIVTYWVNGDENIASSSRGPLSDVLSWLDTNLSSGFSLNFDNAGPIHATLRGLPAVIKYQCVQLPQVDWSKRPFQTEWSQTEILCHLRDVDEEVNLSRIGKVLHEDNPFLPGKDTDPWAEERDYIAQDGLLALTSFMISRNKILSLLDNLTYDHWEKKARHAIFGPTSLLEILRIICKHDRLHLQQIIKTQSQLKNR